MGGRAAGPSPAGRAGDVRHGTQVGPAKCRRTSRPSAVHLSRRALVCYGGLCCDECRRRVAPSINLYPGPVQMQFTACSSVSQLLSAVCVDAV